MKANLSEVPLWASAIRALKPRPCGLPPLGQEPLLWRGPRISPAMDHTIPHSPSPCPSALP